MAKKKAKEENEELNIQHRVVIEAEGINISDLPSEIKSQMRAFNAKLDKYEETGDIDLFYELRQDDVLISDNIQSWFEDMKSDDDNEEEVEYDPEEGDEDEEEVEEEEEQEEKEEKEQEEKEEKEQEEKEEEEEEDDEDEENENKKQIQSQNQQQSQNQNQQQSQQQQPNNNDLEAIVRQNLKDGRIEFSLLKSLIGREPNYPNERIGNLKLRKIFLTTTYGVV